MLYTRYPIVARALGLGRVRRASKGILHTSPDVLLCFQNWTSGVWTPVSTVLYTVLLYQGSRCPTLFPKLVIWTPASTVLYIVQYRGSRCRGSRCTPLGFFAPFVSRGGHFQTRGRAVLKMQVTHFLHRKFDYLSDFYAK